MSPGGIRADILFAASGNEAGGAVTYGEAFAVHPFGNSLVTMSLAGAQIRVACGITVHPRLRLVTPAGHTEDGSIIERWHLSRLCSVSVPVTPISPPRQSTSA